jgi:hypothetical protein
MDLYIYYKVQDADAASLQVSVRALQAGLAASHGVCGLLRRRPETKDGVQTWMEVYPAVPAGFVAVLEDAVAQAGLAAMTSGPRHTEVFTDVEPCV